ncbi:MAG: glutamate synthase subunit beta [Candidatus Omnitrophica bacterium]|nr:glutamate synthase subunit beta [Candidatus Omnitrophota bacterium]MDE2009861.1 glutamate synthase subunit beta [Candidatus Omnitrophota bacterium]MDE2214357.1 glutamate synthase subunit beta [Candidatus Omnitrophota bacterium]MDE2231106.1 glutamate synthase subunit beta [Candidatus Omnitrophota bacterium]
MGDIRGYIKYDRQDCKKDEIYRRIKNFKEFTHLPSDKELRKQGARCMDCGVPFCQSGCPVGNIIPDWNDLVYRDCWQEAVERLHKTNNFPEFTGRICPAPCENACVLGINAPPVTIKNIELAIIEHAYANGWISPHKPKHRTGKSVAVIGSGPAGLACADELNKTGHKVTVFEKNEVLGGLLSMGIPDFKLEKWVVKRRLDRMRQEGVVFKTNAYIGVDIKTQDLRNQHDAIVLCGGAEVGRELPVSGRELKGVYQAMYYLPQQNLIDIQYATGAFKERCVRHILQVKPPSMEDISAKGKRVIVLGGGDTGSDCVGTAIRQGALSVHQLELLPQPPLSRTIDNPWPNWAFIFRTSSSQEEGCVRDYNILTKSLSGEGDQLKKLHAVRLQWSGDAATGQMKMNEMVGSAFDMECDLLLLALGFTGPVKAGMIEDLGVALDARGNVAADSNKMTSVPGVFTAGDMTRGQSLVVWAINEGRAAAKGVHHYLMARAGIDNKT